MRCLICSSRGLVSPINHSILNTLFLAFILFPLAWVLYNRMLPANFLELSTTSSFVYLYLLPTSLFTIRPNTLTKVQSKRLNQTNLFTNKRQLDKMPTNLINPLKAYYIISLKVNSFSLHINFCEVGILYTHWSII